MTPPSADPLGRRALFGCSAALVLLAGLMCLGAAAYTAGMVVVWKLPGYQQAIDEVERSQRAQQLLGDPISDGWLTTIQFGRSDPSDNLELRVQVPVHGSLRSATVYTVLEQGETGFHPSSVLLDVSGEVVDLMERNVVEASEAVGDQRTNLLEEVDAHMATGDFQAALTAADQAVELDPHTAITWVARSRARAHLGDVDGALQDAAQAVKIAPSQGDAQRAAADVYRVNELWERCIEAATEHIRLTHRDGLAWTLRARCFAGNGQIRQALAGAREACTRGDPDGCRYAEELETTPPQ